MSPRPASIAAILLLVGLLFDAAAFARGGRMGGGGARPSGGGGSMSRPSGGVSRPSTGGSYRPSGGSSSRPSGGGVSRPSGGNVSRPSGGVSKPSGGRVPSTPSQRPSTGTLPSRGGSVSQLPSGTRPGTGGATRPSQLPSTPGTGVAGGRPSQLPTTPGAGSGANRPSTLPSRPGGGVVGGPSQLPGKPNVGSGARPGTLPSQRPSQGDLGNFLGIAGGVAGGAALGGAIANRPSQLPANRPGTGDHPGSGDRPAQLPTRPQDRPNWGEWSGNRDDAWQDRVDNAHNSWNNWKQQKQNNLDQFRNNQQQSWNNIESSASNWQNNREDMWEYRADRADEIRDNVGDAYYDHFDDHWWHGCGWGIGLHHANPWWWWVPATIGATALFVDAVTPEPVYVDYGPSGGAYYYGPGNGSQSQSVVINDQPVPATKQSAPPVIEQAAAIEQPPPPMPPAEGKQAEWMPLGVYALAQQEEGDPVMFFQISVNREGTISGAYSNALTNDNRRIAGQVDKKTQRAAWRIGDNPATIFETSLGNLTLEVSPVAIHFAKTQTQTWLLVRIPEPAPADKPASIPEISRKPPSAKTPAPSAK